VTHSGVYCAVHLQCVWGNSRQIGSRWNSTSSSECSTNCSRQTGVTSSK